MKNVVAAGSTAQVEYTMHGRWVTLAALNGMMAVIAGAFGAHALRGRLDLEARLIFEVGARYQMYHALALLAVAWMSSLQTSRLVRMSGVCMVLGIVLFSGSLYGLALTGMRWLVAITPLGGLLLVVGWLLLAVAGITTRCSNPGKHTMVRSPGES